MATRGARRSDRCKSTRNTYLQTQYRRLASRRGKKRALVAVGHTILIDTWHMITNQTEYHDLGADYFTTRIDRRRHTQHLISQLQHLGYTVQLNPEQNGQTATLTR